MTVAIIVIGIAALMSTGLAMFLLLRLLQSNGGSSQQDTALGHQVGEIRQGIGQVNQAIQNLNLDRAKQSERLETMLTSLNSSSSALRDILANTQVRGQWGERMAEDVFRLIGFVEPVNYVKQAAVTDGTSRPDFTIFMPNNMKLNMDAKFPLTNYMKFVEAESEQDAQEYSRAFIRDVRDRAREVVGRDYINPQDNTLDYVLVFIPNEYMFHYIQQHGASVVEEALRNRVVLCSPISLFAILSVIRHAMDNFAVEQASNEILSQIGAFDRQWERFTKHMELVGKRIDLAQTGFEALAGTRRRALERPLGRIQAIREQRGLPVSAGDGPADGDDSLGLPESEPAEE
ncbi:MAG: DNA recombination protein RmuC [Chloroflexi bacterium]|nr:DNA recombination protein RmuC [Chloroflexota bacterium]MDA1270830.1 DNA recombination protein RmuC [Chloroflexota bacterium]